MSRLDHCRLRWWRLAAWLLFGVVLAQAVLLMAAVQHVASLEAGVRELTNRNEAMARRCRWRATVWETSDAR